ncbi:hypothetical protein LWI29_008550 [Acer saccharum]|uniref:Alpha/beta hydrolase fold-3 domain-containing protein n=1 Tax=Acer saccharum TaxID=4024 RepID=A0AA39RQI3_ACESA|nr:hypothetical protein LWI29_008550 [Acer saccharum]
MESTKPEIDYEFLPRFRVYKDGHVERLMETDFVPAVSNDPITGVSSKDITIVQEPNNINISARLYLPKLTTTTTTQKFPLLVYFHGGAFCISSPFTSMHHNCVNALVTEANVVAVSVNYRKAPEHPIPAAYEDSWAALKWVASHSSNNGGGGGPESWLNHHADFERVFLAGDSAGANIAHNTAMAAGSGDSEFGLNVEILGIALVHPYFWGSDPIGSESLHPAIRDSGRALVCVAENDVLKDRGWVYYNALSRCGWMGVAEIIETDGEDHVFHLHDLQSEKAKDLIRRLAAFFNRDMPPLP